MEVDDYETSTVVSEKTDDLTFLISILPEGYESIITDFNQADKENQFNCIIRFAIFQKEDALRWLKEFEKKSLTTWKVLHTFRELTPRIVFKRTYHCLHNTRPKVGSTPHEKHTNCPAKLSIKIKSLMKRSNDEFLRTHPCEIYMRFIHNHGFNASSILKHRVPTEAVKKAFEELFMKYYSPSIALQSYKFDLRMKHGDNYYKIAMDGAVCPKQHWVYDLYNRVFKKEYGASVGDKRLTLIEKYIEEYNEECGEICAVSKKSDAGFSVALCSPLMKRVHTLLENSKEVIFIDCPGSMWRNNRIFIIMCATPIGALPLGIFMTDSESEESIKQGLTLLLTLFPESSFYGQKYASVIITDDCTTLRNSLKKIFPKSKLYLCIFHILQNVMRSLCLEQNNVESEDGQNFYRDFQKILYLKKVEDFEENITYLNAMCEKYECFQNYFQKLYKRADEWALCYRVKTLENNINNYCEATFRILRDKFFQGLKSFNILQMFYFLASKFDAYYCSKITDIMNRKENEKYYFSDAELRGLEGEFIGSSLYKVQNLHSNETYIIDATAFYCTCYIGCSGAPCKHQFFVCKKFNIPFQFFIDNDDVPSKLMYHEIAYGADLPSDWFSRLTSKEPGCSGTSANAITISSVMSISNESDLTEISNEIDSTEISNEIDSTEISNEIELTYEAPEEFISNDSATQLLDIEKFSEHLKFVFEDLNNKLVKNPAVFAEPIQKFIENYQNCKTESSVVSALHTFGNYNGMPLIKRGEILQEEKIIDAQPTAIAQREIKIASRTLNSSGGPPKTCNAVEHCNGQRKIKKTTTPHTMFIKIAPKPRP